MIRKKGFTLAEVLITLGIIGIIAALTIPHLISKWQRAAFNSAFKKNYSVLQNAINAASNDEGLNCYAYEAKGAYEAQTNDCPALIEYIANTIGLQPIKTNRNKLYPSATEVLNKGGSSLSNSCSFPSRFSTPYVMKNGTYVYFFPNRSDYYGASLILDINGESGPNKWGYDVYFMIMSNRNGMSVTLTDEYGSLVNKGGLFPRTILRNQTKNTNFDKLW